MRLDESSPANAGVLAFIRSVRGDHPTIAPPDSVTDPYSEQGSHPDVVERIWDELGKALPADCRCLVLGTPALVHPTAGVVLAFSLGTRYHVRRPSDAQRASESETGPGPGWASGDWSAVESEQCAAVYAEIDRAGGSAP